jgi:haloalkane dehalogenase
LKLHWGFPLRRNSIPRSGGHAGRRFWTDDNSSTPSKPNPSPSKLVVHPTAFFPTGDGALAYTDVGDGPPLLFLHGNPTWAYLYRHLIRGLAPSYRCIAPDYLGFGRSEKPADFSYRPPDHADHIAALCDRLELSTLTLVAHDWGGPIGLSVAVRQPERVRRLVLFNTWGWPHDGDPWIQAFSLLAGGPLGRVLIRRYNAFARWLLPLAFARRARLSDTAFRQYTDPLDTPERRMPSWIFPRALRTDAPWLRTLWSQRHLVRDRPVWIGWGMRDPAFGAARYLRRWTTLFPEAEMHRFHAGHYVPEEMGPSLVSPVRAFLDRTTTDAL